MIYLGDYPVGAVIDFKWASQGLDGASITLGTDGTLRLFKNNSAVDRASTAGITFSEDFNGIVGIHHLRIDTSDDTDPGFYAAATEYQLVGTGLVVDGKTVNPVLCHFSLGRTRVPMPTTSHLKRNQALAKFVFQMTNGTTHAPQPGLTGITVTRSIDGVASVVGTLTNITEHPDADGSYLVDFGAGDLDGKVIKLKAVKDGMDTTQERIITVP